MQITIKRKNLNNSFLEHITKRAEEWSHADKVSSRIVVPPELKFWYFQEFGTAVRGDVGRASGRPFNIYPVVAKALRWPNAAVPNRPDGSRVQGFVLNHPGIYPQHMITRNLQLFLKIAADHLRTAWRREPLSLLAAREGLRDKTMPVVKSHIVEAMRRQIPGTRIDGKLVGQTAGGVFDREATIVDTTSSTGFRPFQTRPIGLRALGAARSYDVVSKLFRSELNRAERLALMSARNEQEYKSSLKTHRLSAYHKARSSKRKKP